MPVMTIRYSSDVCEVELDPQHFQTLKAAKQSASMGEGTNTQKIELIDQLGITRHVKESGKWQAVD